eukprot:GHVS01047092.1.p1 GENE.GHVS01047092.1~~GHVS01047092.1.p1  ORF type:complete len:289 (-),score=56.41 GHVS01047092.1:124-990(-)
MKWTCSRGPSPQHRPAGGVSEIAAVPTLLMPPLAHLCIDQQPQQVTAAAARPVAPGKYLSGYPSPPCQLTSSVSRLYTPVDHLGSVGASAFLPPDDVETSLNFRFFPQSAAKSSSSDEGLGVCHSARADQQQLPQEQQQVDLEEQQQDKPPDAQRPQTAVHESQQDTDDVRVDEEGYVQLVTSGYLAFASSAQEETVEAIKMIRSLYELRDKFIPIYPLLAPRTVQQPDHLCSSGQGSNEPNFDPFAVKPMQACDASYKMIKGVFFVYWDGVLDDVEDASTGFEGLPL